MSISSASILVYIIGAYLALGVLFAVPFSLSAVNRIDPDARGGSWGFRLIILPGVMALWPLMLKRVLAGRDRPPIEKSAHRSVKP